VLLLVLAGLGVLVSEDEVNLYQLEYPIEIGKCMSYLVGSTALVGTEHDDVGGSVGELVSVERRVVLEKLHVCTTTLQAICKHVSGIRDGCASRKTYPGA
jgi:hypothetical protein